MDARFCYLEFIMFFITGKYKMIHPIVQNAITILHILFMVFVFGVPFTDSNYFLLLYAIFVPFVVIHWLCNDRTCVLCIGEQMFRSKVLGDDDPENCISCHLIHPVYEFKEKYKKHGDMIYGIVIFLWITTLVNLGMRYKKGNIDGFCSMFHV